MTRGGGGEPDTLPVSFARAMDSIRSVVLRSEVHVEETPAPQRLSPYAIALQATVVVDPRGEDEAASGRFVLLHDPAGQEPWDGTFRIVTFAKGTVEIDIAGDVFGPGRLLIFKPGDRISILATSQARIMLLGGEPMDGPRHIWWNFVSSRKERIDQAKAEWRTGKFDSVPGESEFIPLPD